MASDFKWVSCALVPSCWKCFQHIINCGVRSGRLAMAEDWMEASSPLGLLIADRNFNVFWTLVSQKAQNKYTPARNPLILLPEFLQFLLFTAFYYLLHHCCWVEWVNRDAEKKAQNQWRIQIHLFSYLTWRTLVFCRARGRGRGRGKRRFGPGRRPGRPPKFMRMEVTSENGEKCEEGTQV